MRSLFDSPKAMASVNFRRLPGGLHSVAKQASFNIAFGVDLEGFGKPRWIPNVDFQAFFFDVILECVFVSNFNRFLEAQNQKNSNFHIVKQ